MKTNLTTNSLAVIIALTSGLADAGVMYNGFINNSTNMFDNSASRIATSFPNMVMQERNKRLALENQQRLQQEKADQAEYQRTGIMPRAMQADYDRRVAAQAEADKALSPADLAEVMQYRNEDHQHMQQLLNEKLRLAEAQRARQQLPDRQYRK